MVEFKQIPFEEYEKQKNAYGFNDEQMKQLLGLEPIKVRWADEKNIEHSLNENDNQEITKEKISIGDDFKQNENSNFDIPEVPNFKAPETSNFELPEMPDFKLPEEQIKNETLKFELPNIEVDELPKFSIPKFDQNENSNFDIPEVPNFETPETSNFELPEMPDFKLPEEQNFGIDSMISNNTENTENIEDKILEDMSNEFSATFEKTNINLSTNTFINRDDMFNNGINKLKNLISNKNNILINNSDFKSK